MQRLSMIDPSTATPAAREVMGRVAGLIGRVPKMIQLMANSPQTVDAYLQFNGALVKGVLPRELRVLIAATVAEANGCEYSQQIARGMAGGTALTPEDLDAARRAQARDEKVAAALRFAQRVVLDRGSVAVADVQAARAAGYGDAEITEIVGTVALNIFRNYFNLVAGTEIDPTPSTAPKVTQ